MITIKVLGTGCAKCKKQVLEAEEAVRISGATAQVIKVEKLDDIMQYEVFMTPAVVVNEELKASGRVVPASEIAKWLAGA